MTAFAKTFRVGDYVEGDYLTRVVIELKINTHLTSTETPYQTVTHDFVTEVDRLSIMGSARESVNGGRTFRSGSNGQILDDLRKVTRFAKAGEKGTTPSGWSADKRDMLLELWEDWHLNDLQAGCAHQEIVYEVDKYSREVPSLELTKPCPLTGYEYGRSWLVKPLTDEVYREIEALLEVEIHRQNDLIPSKG